MSRNFRNRTGEIHTTNEGYEVEIISWEGVNVCSIRFLYNGFIMYNKQYGDIKRGRIKNPFHPSVHGIGYIGEGCYCLNDKGRRTQAGSVWNSVLQRCYSNSYQERHPAYKTCLVDPEWHNFQNFAKWYYENYKQDYQLDKDILIKGNKIYSPENCCFVPREINMFFIKLGENNAALPKYIKKEGNKYVVSISVGGKKIYLGSHISINEAVIASQKGKSIRAKELAEKYKDMVDSRVYEKLINFKIRYNEI